MVAEGHRAVMLYLVQRSDCTDFAIASDIDPAYAAAFAAAQKAGVECLIYGTQLSPEGVEIAGALENRVAG
jgi:sugar fermentation stimulation protein A